MKLTAGRETQELIERVASLIVLQLEGAPLRLGGIPRHGIGARVTGREIALCEQRYIIPMDPAAELPLLIQHWAQRRERLGLQIQFPGALGDLPLLPEDVEIHLLE